MVIKLSRAALRELPKSVGIPRYESCKLKAGILHIGVGNFHRAHQAVYLDDLFNMEIDWDWAIVGAGVRSEDVVTRLDLLAQDLLTTVMGARSRPYCSRVVGSMIEFLEVHRPLQMLDRLKDPAIRIVSLTITEGGYFINPASGSFELAHPEIVSDALSIAAPRTVFGLILAGLIARRESGDCPFTVLSCDNLPRNGDITRSAVIGMAQSVDPALADWISEEVAFPSSMVDRITPVTTNDHRAFLQNRFGIQTNDRFFWPFRQWVLGGSLPLRPTCFGASWRTIRKGCRPLRTDGDFVF